METTTRVFLQVNFDHHTWMPEIETFILVTILGCQKLKHSSPYKTKIFICLPYQKAKPTLCIVAYQVMPLVISPALGDSPPFTC